MKKSIMIKMFVVIMISITVFLVGIGLLTKYMLPKYYLDVKLEKVNDAMIKIETSIKADDLKLTTELADNLTDNFGGYVSIMDEFGGYQGKGKMQRSNTEFEFPDDKLSSFNTTFINKYGIEFYIFGIPYGNEWFIYELPIQSIDEALSIVNQFYVYILGLGVVIAVVTSLLISRSITKPIKEMSNLSERMKNHEISDINFTTRQDEIGLLDTSLKSLYLELISNIQKLESELEKERSLDRLRKQFLAQVSHELQTPLSVIKGYSEILYDGIYKNEEERDTYIKDISKEVENISGIIKDILDISKAENQEIKLNLEDTEIKGYTIELNNRLEQYILSKNISFQFETLEDDFMKKIDPLRYEQIVKNLLTNAINHTSGLIKISFERVNDKIKLSVYNTGQNIPEKEILFIFDPFYKLNTSKKGTGLGLSIVKRFVEVMNGDYMVINHSDGVEFIVIV